MPGSKINKMLHKADNLRTIERMLENIKPHQEYTNIYNYIKHLKITLTCLLDSVHDFGIGPLLSGTGLVGEGYIGYIINILIKQANLLHSPSPNHIKEHIINWLNGWNAISNHPPSNFPIIASYNMVPNSGSILDFINGAIGVDEAENFVAFLLKVDSAVVNRFDNNTQKPDNSNAVHKGAIAVVHEHNYRKTNCPKFLESLYNANNSLLSSNNKFFTIRDNGFGSYIFHDKDTNGTQSLTDTIYTGPGKWDNGGNDQYVKNKSNKKISAKGVSIRFEIKSNNILSTMSSDSLPADGGVLGFRYIKTIDDNTIVTQNGIYFGNTIYTSAPVGKYEYETYIPFSTLKSLNKNSIKTVITALIKNHSKTSISYNDLKTQMRHWFQPVLGTSFGSATMNSGETVLKYAINQSLPIRKQNINMIIGCLLDTKRSGDFLQSASVKELQSQGSPFNGRTGIFATNDRIAGYISAKIHENYTILSIKGTPFTMAAIWNAPNKTLVGNNISRPRQAIKPENLSSTNKNVIVGGNKKQKYGKRQKCGNMKSKKGGGFMSNEPFKHRLEEFTALYNEFNNAVKTDINLMYKLYEYIDTYQELIKNLFKNFFASKITSFDNDEQPNYYHDDDVSIPDMLKNSIYIPNREEEVWTTEEIKTFIKCHGEYDNTKLLLEFISSNAFNEFPNFIEQLDIFVHVKGEIVFNPMKIKEQSKEQSIMYYVELYTPFIFILKSIFEYQKNKINEYVNEINKLMNNNQENNLNLNLNQLSAIDDYLSYVNDQNAENGWQSDVWDIICEPVEPVVMSNSIRRIYAPRINAPSVTFFDQDFGDEEITKESKQNIIKKFEEWAKKNSNSRLIYEKITDIMQICKEDINYKFEDLVTFLKNCKIDYISKLNTTTTRDSIKVLTAESYPNPSYKALHLCVIKGLSNYYDLQVTQWINEVKSAQEISRERLENNGMREGYNKGTTNTNRDRDTDTDRERHRDRDRDRYRDRYRDGERERDGDGERERDGGTGTSIKSVLYLVKIEKLRELNKELRKNKTKNKKKIEKNNKQIDEFKIKIKKEKEKEKLKKQKEKKIEKEKLKKQKEKKQKQKEKQKVKKEKTKKSNTKINKFLIS